MADYSEILEFLEESFSSDILNPLFKWSLLLFFLYSVLNGWILPLISTALLCYLGVEGCFRKLLILTYDGEIVWIVVEVGLVFAEILWRVARLSFEVQLDRLVFLSIDTLLFLMNLFPWVLLDPSSILILLSWGFWSWIKIILF